MKESQARFRIWWRWHIFRKLTVWLIRGDDWIDITNDTKAAREGEPKTITLDLP